ARRQHGRALPEERQILVDQNPEEQVQELVWRGSGCALRQPGARVSLDRHREVPVHYPPYPDVGAD
ncbi:hypothetical protein LLE87_37255, partial [Paenibacillus polymyxa]|nr:hypothetical protein [Paenibacillus polymyxa]